MVVPSLQSPEKPHKTSTSPQGQNIRLFAFLLGVTIVLVFTYTLTEKTFYWWDYTTYSEILERKSADFQTSPLQALGITRRSAGNDYSDYPALLLLPFRWAFGNSRFVFILSIALVYLLPFGWVLGTIATQLIPASPSIKIRWITGLMAIATPLFWAPTLRGYVDVGAALLIALAVRVYLQDVTLRSRWQILAIGFLLGFAPLFRRHYTYAVAAFFVAMILQTIIFQGQQNARWQVRAIVQRGLRIGWIAVTSLVTLLVFGWHFILVVLRTNFTSLYASYEVSLTEGLQYYGVSYGWIAAFLAGLGFAIGFKKRWLSHSAASFILLFYGLLFLLWVNKVKLVGVHYTTHFTPLIILGLVALCWAILRWAILQDRRVILLGVFGLYLGLNFWIGLAPVNALDRTPLRPTRMRMSLSADVVGTTFSELFAANNPPLRRTDQDELARLVQTLRTIAPQKQSIYVGAASSILNSNLLDIAEKVLYGDRLLNVLATQDVDSRDRYPIEQILQADYLVVATPFQHEIRPQDQEIVRVVGDIFTEQWQISKDFTRLPSEFHLDHNVTVHLYQRQRSTSLATVLNTLEAMQASIDSRPGSQLDWVRVNKTPGYDLWQDEGADSLGSNATPTRSTALVYINSLPKQRLNLRGQIQYSDRRQCSGVEVRLSGISRTAQILQTAKLDHSPAAAADFSLPVSTQDADYLLLEINSKTSPLEDLQRCAITVRSFRVSAN